MEARGGMSADQMDRALRIQSSIAKVFSYCAPVFSLIYFALVAAILMLAFRMMGGEGDYRHYFSVTLYAWVPRFLQSMIMTGILAFRTEPVGAELLPTLVRSNLGFLVDPKTQAVLFTLLSSLDVFAIWGLVLMAIGFAHVSRFSKGKSAGIVVSLWAFVLLIKVGFASLGALMRTRK
jgi:hypothetical protein